MLVKEALSLWLIKGRAIAKGPLDQPAQTIKSVALFMQAKETRAILDSVIIGDELAHRRDDTLSCLQLKRFM